MHIHPASQTPLQPLEPQPAEAQQPRPTDVTPTLSAGSTGLDVWHAPAALSSGELPALDPATLSPAKAEVETAAKTRRLEIYYGTSDRAQIRQLALQQLNLSGPPLSLEQKKANFARFAQAFFPQPAADDDPFDLHYSGPQPDTRTYQTLQAYALTDYGAAMIQKGLAEAESGSFQVKIIEDASPQGWNDFMVFPPNFPPEQAHFKISGQPVDPLAIVHHEFEHTRFGRFANHDDDVLADEVHAVRDVENPVRVLNGYEPRYTYTQIDALGQPIQTLSILQPEQVRPGAWTFDPQDPRRLKALP